MDGVPFTDEQEQRYRANIKALGQTQPALSQLIESTSLPPTVETAKGRDGSDTVRIHQSDGSGQWFGHSSMPTISAPVVTAAFTWSGRNVVLTSVGTGCEILVLASRSPAHCAIFAFDNDIISLKIAMILFDYSDLLARGRLLFACGSHAGQTLHELICSQPGLEYPQEMFALPHQPTDERARIRREFEAGGALATAHQASLAANVRTQLQERSTTRQDGPRRIVVLSRDPRPEAIAVSRGLANRLNETGYIACVSVPDRPDQCHVLARLRTVHDHNPDGIILVNCLSGPLSGYLPDELPVRSWLLTRDSARVAISEGIRANSVIYAAHSTTADELVAAGAAAEHARLLERAADQAAYHPVTLSADQRAAYETQVAVRADGIDLGAEAAGITLDTHSQLWDWISKTMQASEGSWRRNRADKLLKQGEAAVGLSLKDADLRDQFLSLIRHRLAPVMAVRHVVGRLIDEGFEVAVWGTGWATQPDMSERVPDLDGREMNWNLVYNGAQLVVLPWFNDSLAQCVLDSLAAGTLPVFVRPATHIRDLHPQLAGLLEQVPHVADPDQISGKVKRLLQPTEEPAGLLNRLRAEVMSQHTYDQRLVSLLEGCGFGLA